MKPQKAKKVGKEVYAAYMEDISRLPIDIRSSPEQQKSFMQPETSMGKADSEKSLTVATDKTQQITTSPTSSNITEISEIGEHIRVKIVVSLPKDDKEAWEKAKRKVDNTYKQRTA